MQLNSDLLRKSRICSRAQRMSFESVQPIALDLGCGVSHRYRSPPVCGMSDGCGLSRLGRMVCCAFAGITTPKQPSSVELTNATPYLLSVQPSPPACNGGTPILFYEVQLRHDDDLLAWCEIVKAEQPTKQSLGPVVDIDALRPGMCYRVRARAVNAEGAGPWCESANALTTLTTVPGAPGPPLQMSNSPDSVSVIISAPDEDGGLSIEHFRLETSGAASAWREMVEGVEWTMLSWSAADQEACVQLINLEPAQSIVCRAAAKNRNGYGATGAASEKLVSAKTVPSAPLDLHAGTAGAGTDVACDWHAPVSDGGSAVLRYVVFKKCTGHVDEAKSDGVSSDWSEAAVVDDSESQNHIFVVLKQLEHGCMYAFRVQAENAIGSGQFNEVPHSIITHLMFVAVAAKMVHIAPSLHYMYHTNMYLLVSTNMYHN